MALRFPRLRINRTWGTLIVALILGLVAAWLATQYIKAREHSIAQSLAARNKSGPTVSVVVPVRNLPQGTPLTANLVAARSIPADLVYPGTITPDQFKSYEGSKLLDDVLRGRPLREEDVHKKVKDFSELIPDGTRAITVDVNEVNSVANMIRPGNLVDLFLIMPDPKDPASQQIVLLLQKLKVMAVGQTTHNIQPSRPAGLPGAPGTVQYTNMTFEATPEQAARLALAQQLGRLRAVLRAGNDGQVAKLDPINSKTLISDAEGPTHTVQYIVGGSNTGGGGVSTPLSVALSALQAMRSNGGAQAGTQAPQPGAPQAPQQPQMLYPGIPMPASATPQKQ
jgi:pilus assembly protein CpaB